MHDPCRRGPEVSVIIRVSGYGGRYRRARRYDGSQCWRKIRPPCKPRMINACKPFACVITMRHRVNLMTQCHGAWRGPHCDDDYNRELRWLSWLVTVVTGHESWLLTSHSSVKPSAAGLVPQKTLPRSNVLVLKSKFVTTVFSATAALIVSLSDINVFSPPSFHKVTGFSLWKFQRVNRRSVSLKFLVTNFFISKFNNNTVTVGHSTLKPPVRLEEFSILSWFTAETFALQGSFIKQELITHRLSSKCRWPTEWGLVAARSFVSEYFQQLMKAEMWWRL